MAQSPRWDDYFRRQLLEHAKETVGVAEPVGQLFGVLCELCGPASLSDLFNATAEGSDVSLVGPIFNFWAMSELVPRPPDDFDDLPSLHRAAIVLSVRAIRDGANGMSQAQIDVTALIRSRARGYGGLMIIMRSELEKRWCSVALRASEKFAQSFHPARWTALACLGSVIQRPDYTAYCLAQLDPSLRKLMLKRTIELLADCPA